MTRCKVGSDVTRSLRACMRARRFVRQNPPMFCSLQQACKQKCPLRVRRTSSTLAGQDMASGTEPSEQGFTSSIGSLVSTSDRSPFVRVGTAPVSFCGALEVQTVTFLSRTDTEHSGPRAPVTLGSLPAMCRTGALLGLRTGKTFEIRVAPLALHSSLGACFNERLLHQRGDAQTNLRHFELVAAWVSATPFTWHAATPRDFIRKRSTCV